jgi:acyl-CoA synthetase (NDP forming)
VREATARIEGQGFPVYPQVNRAISALSYLSKQARLAQSHRT